MGLWKHLKAIVRYLKREEYDLRQFAIGMSSEVDIKKDLHLLFLDYDGCDLEQVEDSIKECQNFWNLSDCFIYKTHNGYHAYFFYDIMPYSRVLMILNYAKYVDDKFRFISRYYDYKTIRQAGKYKERDIYYVKMLSGSRQPTLWELEVGDLKRRERKYLAGMSNMLREDKLA